MSIKKQKWGIILVLALAITLVSVVSVGAINHFFDALGDFVWEDLNGNGRQDAGELGIEGVRVQLVTSGGALVASTTTNASGIYSFEGFEAGDYIVRFINPDPAVFEYSPANLWAEDIDSDPLPATGETLLTNMGIGVTNLDKDAGFVRKKDGAGCTPGFWKNHLDAWGPTGLDPGDDFDTTFGVDFFDPDITLGEAVNAKGGGVNKLARHGTAALLSALHPDVGYPLSAGEVIAAVQAGDVDTLVNFNELGCPID